MANCDILGNFVKDMASTDDGAISDDFINNLPDYGGAIVFYVMVDHRSYDFIDTVIDCGILLITAISRILIGWWIHLSSSYKCSSIVNKVTVRSWD